MGQFLRTSAEQDIGTVPGDISAPRNAHSLRVALRGMDGVGKSHFVASIPNCFVLDTEDAHFGIPERPESSTYVTLGKTPVIEGSRVVRWKIVDRIDHLKAVMRYLMTPEAQNRYHTLVFDTMDRWVTDTIDLLTRDYNSYIEQSPHISNNKKVNSMTEYGQGGAGWSRVHKSLFRTWRSLSDQGFGFWMVCHKVWTKRSETGVREQELAISPGVQKYLHADVDLIGDISRGVKTTIKEVTYAGLEEVQEVEEKTPACKIMFNDGVSGLSGAPPAEGTKDRIPLPEDIAFGKHEGWGKFVEAYNASVYTLYGHLPEGE